jgi:RNA polymerase sigma-70 factor (ECF subfamily)
MRCPPAGSQSQGLTSCGCGKAVGPTLLRGRFAPVCVSGLEPGGIAGVELGHCMASDEQGFLERLKRRDEAAFNELVAQNQGAVYRVLLRMLGNAAEAEDVAQEVFVSAFKAMETFRGDSALSTWLYRIAQNQGRNRLKYLARRTRDTGHAPGGKDNDGVPGHGAQAPADARPDRTAEAHEASQHIEHAFGELEPEQRLLLALRDQEHLSYDDLVQVTGLPLGTVKSRLHRARLALAQRFAELQEGRR